MSDYIHNKAGERMTILIRCKSILTWQADGVFVLSVEQTERMLE